MIIWQFKLDDLIIEEPLGFEDISFNINRDPQWHGVIFEATTSSLKFYGIAFNYLKDAKESLGVDARVIFTALQKCEGESDFTIALQGKLNFGRYNEQCGNLCTISLPVEQADCTMLFKNRFDQKVSVDSVIAFDKQTILERYANLGNTIQFAPQATPITADGNVELSGDGGIIDTGLQFTCNMLIRPVYSVIKDASINATQLDGVASFYQDCKSTFLLTPQVLIDEPSECLPIVPPFAPNFHSWSYTVRLKGTIKHDVTAQLGAGTTESAKLILSYWDANGSIITNQTIIAQNTVQANMANGTIYAFDQTYTGSAVIPEGVGVYAYLLFTMSGGNGGSQSRSNVTYNFLTETSFLFSGIKVCPPTNAKVYLVNELLSRITESITNRCLTVKSDYYGRADSQPYASLQDGCGGLRVLTNGLRIRLANDKEFFASIKEVLEGLKAIDNIGMGIEVDKLRVEPVKYFYNEDELLVIDLVPEMQKQIVENLIYTTIKVGYKKWEIKSAKGIDEFNSTKEFRTNISSLTNTLDITSDLISSGYVIENLRSSTLAGTGNADNTYDNDIFIVCVERTYEPQKRKTTFTDTPINGTFYYEMTEGLFLAVGSQTTISDTVSNNGLHTITKITNDGYYYYFTTNLGTSLEVNVLASYTNIQGRTAGVLAVEQGVTDNATNVFSPSTMYNWRIRPLYNLMRWAKSIYPAYTNLVNTINKIFFTSGTGNYLATGSLPVTDLCRLENQPLAENVDLSVGMFNSLEYVPAWKPETISFDYPLSIKDYNLIKKNPYGYIKVQCGMDEFIKGYVKEIQYSPVKGNANFTLLLKWK